MITKVVPCSIKDSVYLKMGLDVGPNSFEVQGGIQGLESCLC